MKKKTYSNPVSSVVTIPPMVLLSSSLTQSILYDPNSNTEEALAPFLDLEKMMVE